MEQNTMSPGEAVMTVKTMEWVAIGSFDTNGSNEGRERSMEAGTLEQGGIEGALLAQGRAAKARSAHLRARGELDATRAALERENSELPAVEAAARSVDLTAAEHDDVVIVLRERRSQIAALVKRASALEAEAQGTLRAYQVQRIRELNEAHRRLLSHLSAVLQEARDINRAVCDLQQEALGEFSEICTNTQPLPLRAGLREMHLHELAPGGRLETWLKDLAAYIEWPIPLQDSAERGI